MRQVQMRLLRTSLRRSYFGENYSMERLRHYRLFVLVIITALLGVLFLRVQQSSAAHTSTATSERAYVVTNVSQVSSTTSIPFTVAIGDTIDETYSLQEYVTVAGMYTGGGTVVFRFDNKVESEEVYVLPTSTSPQEFRFIFADNAGVLRHKTAGQFTHQLDISPRDVDLHNLAIHATETFARKPVDVCTTPSGSQWKSQTMQYWVGYTETLNSVQDFPLSFELFDVDPGDSAPIQSAYVELVGLTKNEGSMTLGIVGADNTFTALLLPESELHPFSVVSSDFSTVFNQRGRGSQVQLLRITPGGNTVLSPVSVKLTVTYRSKPTPPTCGLPAVGVYTSPVFDTQWADGVLYQGLLWKGRIAQHGEGRVRAQLATSRCANGAHNFPQCSVGGWEFRGGLTCSNVDWFDMGAPNKPFNLFSSGCREYFDERQFYRYRVQLCSKDCVRSGQETPVVDEFSVSFSP